MTDKQSNFRFLPLGTFIKVKKQEETIFMIVARALKTDKMEISAQYRIAEHPEGDRDKTKPVIILDDDIVEIVHKGFESEADDSFLKDLREKVNASLENAQPKEKEEIPEPDFTIDLSQPVVINDPNTTGQSQEVQKASEDDLQKLEEDPFYKFRVEGES